MDVDADPVSPTPRSTQETSTPKGTTPSNEIRVGPPKGRPVKRPHGESDAFAENGEVEEVVKRKKKAGKEKIEKVFEKLGNFMTKGDIEVIQETDDTIDPIDLSEETVTALTAVDFDMVPFLEHKVISSTP